MDKTGLGFPFHVTPQGGIASASGNDSLRAKLLQVLLTSPGERVNLPKFGCGLRDLVFDPNNYLLAAATEFTVSKALQRWLGDELHVESVDVQSEEETLTIEIHYVRLDTLEPQGLKITF
ncbi:GPW/gp25 family protein [bacterium]|nr:GPW/gp25 family protein [bacterium]